MSVSRDRICCSTYSTGSEKVRQFHKRLCAEMSECADFFHGYIHEKGIFADKGETHAVGQKHVSFKVFIC